MLKKKLKILTALIVLLLGSLAHAGGSGELSPWRFEAGVSAGELTPLSLVTGFGYKNFIFRLQGLGLHSGPNDYWCGLRGSLLWTFFRELPFSFDVGASAGYAFAEAPNEMHKALNKLNGGKYVYPYNYRELLDISLEMWVKLYGVYTQISVPAYRIKEHDAPNFIWGIGIINSL